MKVVKILIVLILLVAFLSFMLNFYLLPARGKKFILTNLEKSINREITFDEVAYSFADGIILTNFAIKAEKGQPFDYILKSKKASFNPLLVPFLSNKKFIIMDLALLNPEINILKKKNNVFNIYDLLTSKDNKKEKSNFLILSLNLQKGQLTYYDTTKDLTYKQKLSNVGFSYKYSFPMSIKFNANGMLNEASLSFSGKYNLKTESLNLAGSVKKLPLSIISNYTKLPIVINSIQGKLNSNFDSSIRNKRIISLKSHNEIENANINTMFFTVEGNVSSSSTIKYNLKEKKFLSTEGHINFKEANLTQVPYVTKITNLTGISTFNKDEIIFKDLKADVLESPTNFSGTLSNYKDPCLDLKVKSELKIDKIIKGLAIEEVKALEKLQIQGKSYAVLNISGRLKKLISLDVSGDISVSDLSIKSQKAIIDLTDIDGKINLSSDKIEIVNFTGYYKDEKFSIDGQLTNFKKPGTSLKIKSDNFFCAANMNKVDKKIFIEKIQGNYFGSNYNITGEINNLSSPLFNLYADLNLDLKDIDKFYPSLSEKLLKYKIEGALPISIHFNGNPKKWKKASAGLKANTEQIKIKGLSINNVQIKAVMQNEAILLSDFTADVYEGTLSANGEINLEKKEPEYSVRMMLKALDLEKLLDDTKFKNKEIAGKTFLKVNFENPIKKLSGISGAGEFLITEGHLLELPALNTLASVIGISEKGKIIFEEAHANFAIKNQTLATDNLMLLSEAMALDSKGNLGFNGNLDFTTTVKLAPSAYEKFGKGGQIAGVFFETLGSYLIRIKTTGNITNPKHTKVSVSSEDLLRKGLLKGFEDILRGF